MLALGYRMGKLALKKLGRAREGGMKLLAVVEFQNCLADGITFVTGATFGKSTLILKPLGKFAASFYDLASGKSIRILVRNEILEATLEYGRRSEEIKNMPVAERKQAAEEHMRRGKEIVAKLMEKSDEELFEIKEAPPFKSRNPTRAWLTLTVPTVESWCLKPTQRRGAARLFAELACLILKNNLPHCTVILR